MARGHQGHVFVRPTLGRIVHYLERGRVNAAIVINIDPADPWHVIINFWDEFGNQHFRAHVPYAGGQPARFDKHWWWPPMPRPTLDDVKRSQSGEDQ